MALSVSSGLSEKRAQAGRRGALKRWGPPGQRVVRLDGLTPEQRRLVLALIEAAKAAPVAHEADAADQNKKLAGSDRDDRPAREVRRARGERPTAA